MVSRMRRFAGIAVVLALGVTLLPASASGALRQLSGPAGCLVDRSMPAGQCTAVRALRGPGPFEGSNAVAVSPDGRYVYVAAARSNAVAILRRDRRSGRLTQARGARGCIAAGGAGGCATAEVLGWPNSVAMSPDGRDVYVTSRDSDAVTVFRRDARTGALTEAGCVAAGGAGSCAAGRGLDGPDVVVVSPDGRNVYVGAFSGNAVAVLARDRSTGALSQASGTSGCVAADATEGCATGLALTAVEGMAVSRDGRSVYAASAISGAVAVFARDRSTGTLAQATDGSGCLVTGPAAGCTPARRLAGANAVALSPDDHAVYVTSLLSNSVTAFARSGTGQLTQLVESFGCVVFGPPRGCTPGRALKAPEGVAVAPDGRSVYVAAFSSGAVDVLRRLSPSGGILPRAGRGGCVARDGSSGCERGRRLRGVSSVAVSPDGRHLYATAFASSAVAVFRTG
ncbi:beta-propeller fold lactonase family protein [Capillimicrobium parvum]|uniref:Lactonase family protein n=1 Tax=Capillimicrobium parvum TaxID=2884022 RepID=A0A9E6XTL3_9ACTN|nr:beta-propeller fold lactonase family protein [Capillimicrobium parvum]UGS34232.1 hypothetical protein DSM104329_00605 [Capillimicrobium parvum]